MNISKKAVPGNNDPQQGGYFISDINATDKIPVFRCPNCFKHMSLFNYSISSLGVVKPAIICPYCSTKFASVVLQGFNSKYSKLANQVFLK